MHKSLAKAYNKRAKQLTKNFTIDKTAGLQLFAEHLRYLRDTLILGPDTQKAVDQATTMTAAVAEFDAYHSSKEQTKKTFHLNNFCEMVKLNIGEWLTNNDSV